MDDKTTNEPSLLNGYPKLASRISQKPELSIFRRFLSLNTENLLYMQAELAILELELKDIVNADLHSGMRMRRQISTSFLALKESSEHGSKRQWLKRQEIKEKLKEYNEAVLRLHQLNELQQPDPGDLSVLRNWLENEHGGNKFLEGDEASIWTEVNELDLFSMAPRPGEGDSFTRWIDGPVLDFLHEKFLYNIMSKRKSRVFDPETGIVDYKDSTLLRITDNISTIVASLFPIISIIILYFIKNTPARLGVIAAFEIIFALGLTFFTKAKRFDVFAANAAFAAVQVVFLSTNNSVP